MSRYTVEWEDHGPEEYKIYYRQHVTDLTLANRIYDMKVVHGLYDVRLKIDGKVYRQYVAPEDESEV